MEAKNSLTKTLLRCLTVAGPIYLVVALLQAFTRPGFDILRHSVSLLSLGDLGWIQVANFMASGLLVIAGSIGLYRVLQGQKGRLWGPLLVGLYGVGLMAAGIFLPDPIGGFPLGTPEDAAGMSSSGMMHFMVGGLGFMALIAACFVFARRFQKNGQSVWARYSVITGIVFLLAFVGIASGSSQPVIILGFWVGVTAAWVWLTQLSLKYLNTLAG